MKDISFEGKNQTELMKAVIAGEPVEKLEKLIEKNEHIWFVYDPCYEPYRERQDSLVNTAQHYALLNRRAPSVLKL